MGPGLIGLAAAVALPLVTHGTGDAADPAIVAIVDAQGLVDCSGTVVAPHLVLTAGHCIVPQIAQGGSVVFGSTAVAPTTTIPIVASRVHPAFDPATLASDAALIVLATAAPVEPLALGTGPPGVGATVRLVGWGKTGGDAGDLGTKRTGTTSVTAVDPSTFTVAATPSQPCAGDSGGPALATTGGVDVLAGITSHGDMACTTGATYTRVDSVASDFIVPAIAALAEGTAPTGAPCVYPEQCADGAASCVAAADDPNVSYCTRSCEVTSCPFGMECVLGPGLGRRCAYPAPTPGAIGWACSSDADCADGKCITGGVCSVRCAPDGAACPGTSQCTNVGGIDFFCELAPPAPTSSSCALAGAPRRVPVFVVLAALLGLARLRRRAIRAR